MTLNIVLGFWFLVVDSSDLLILLSLSLSLSLFAIPTYFFLFPLSLPQNTYPTTIRPACIRITTIPRIIHTIIRPLNTFRWCRAFKSREPTTSRRIVDIRTDARAICDEATAGVQWVADAVLLARTWRLPAGAAVDGGGGWRWGYASFFGGGGFG